jgi:glycine cleavage system regulatory protein
MASLILTLVGPDRPGLVNRVAARVAEAGGSWLESRMSHLAGHFAGIVLIDVPDAAIIALQAALSGEEGLAVAAHPTRPSPAPTPAPLMALELVCQDRPGIVREISQVLADQRANIEELTTDLLSGSFSGESLFRAQIRLRLPERGTTEGLREALERLSADLMVDLKLSEENRG